MKTSLKLILFCVLFFLAVPIFAQDPIDLSKFTANDQSGWKVYKNLESANIFCKKVICKIDDEVSFTYMLFKVVNTSNQSIEITWEFKFYINDQELVKSPDDMQVKLTIEANNIKEGDCQIADDNKLKVLVSEQSGPAMITSIDLVSIKINAK